MLTDVLAYIQDRQGAPVTEIKKTFGLPSDMAANLLVQLVDAGLLHEQALEPCHHMDPEESVTDPAGGCGSSGCASGGCGSGGKSCAVGDAFERGCCGMNSPYHVTDRGRAFLDRMRAIAG